MSCDDPTLYIGPTDQMIFGPIDLGDESPYHHHDQHLSSYSWDPYADVDQDVKPSHFSFASTSPALLSPSYSASLQHSSPPDSYYDPSSVHDQDDMSTEVGQSYINWINDPDGTSAYNSSSPIPIPSSAPAAASPTYMAFSDASHYHSNAFSPTGFAALHPLPRSLSPSSAYDEHQIHSISPQDMSLATPHWASQAWDVSSSLRSPSTIRASVRHSPLTDSTIRASRMPARRGPISSHLFHSSSAPSMSPTLTRALSNRRVPPMSNNSMLEDHDATIRRKKRGSPVDEGSPIPEKGDKADKKDDIPLKSVLRPPKLAPSAWQLYFTDWIQRQQATSTRKLNVAQAAKEAGQEYASLSQEEKEPYKLRSQTAKEERERELAAYMKTLTPEDIKRENAFRAAQRKAGKSRRSNIKDPNAPKKPLSAYFMFLQRIRSEPRLVKDVFGEETETTKQSVLAAAKWRSMTDAERQPFLAQAEQEKMEYEAARRLYEEGHAGYGTNINFSILPGSSNTFLSVKTESESESEGFNTDDGSLSGSRP